MILRKPYAMLIKYFKLIHIAMFIIFGIFVFAIRKIYVFSSDLVKTSNYYLTEGMAGTYVPIYLFLLIILLVVVSIFIYSLMKKKNKPVLFYEVMMGYLFVLLAILIYFRIFFAGLDGSDIEPLRGVVQRDIILFIYLANYFFVAFNFVRGFGFDIKKFSFDQDKKELDIEETDNEEFELNINIDKDKIVAKIRKEKRELGYYIKENIIVVSIVVIIILGFIGFKVYKNVIVPNKYFNENEVVAISNVSYKVRESMMTPYNKYSLVISKGDTFLVVMVDIINNSDKAGTVGDNRFRLNIGDDYYYPNTNVYTAFSDLGTGFRNNTLKAKTTSSFIVIFKLSEGIKGRMFFEILRSANDYSYDRVLLKPKEIEKETKNANMNEAITIDDVELKFTGYKIEKSSFYEYSECEDEEKTKCNTFKKIVSPKMNEKLMVLDVENSLELGTDFFNNYMWIKTDNKEYSSKNLSVVELKNNQIFVSIPKSFESKEFTIIIKKRDVDYNISIKETKDE